MTSRLVSLFHSDPLFIPSLYAYSHKIKDLGHISDSSSILPASATIQLCLWWVGGSHQVSFPCLIDVLASDALIFSDMAKMPFFLWDNGLGHDCASWLCPQNISVGAAQGQDSPWVMDSAGIKVSFCSGQGLCPLTDQLVWDSSTEAPREDNERTEVSELRRTRRRRGGWKCRFCSRGSLCWLAGISL